MANLFDAANSPTTEPQEIVVGDYIQWRRTDLGTDYPNDEYTATYVARITGGGASEIQLAGSAYNDDYIFTVSSDDSADFNPGYYHWQLEIVRNSDGNRIVVDRGDFRAIVDLDVNNSDPRSHAEIMVDKIETVLQGRADADVLSYSIAGRSLTKMSPEELLTWRSHYKREALMERRKERIRRGLPTGAT
ncbi:MAG: hypothetical protein VW577_00545, partial [Pelagibacteraceae bacterium]